MLLRWPPVALHMDDAPVCLAHGDGAVVDIDHATHAVQEARAQQNVVAGERRHREVVD